MGTLVLHIGTHKTGTTALQRFMWENADAMAERGLFVPKPPGAISSRRPSKAS